MLALPWMLWVSLAGCVADGDDAPITDTDAPGDTDVNGETDVGTDRPVETGFEDSDPFQDHDTDTRTGPPSPALDCHPMDPMSYTGWQRQYNLQVAGGVRAKETHAPTAWGAVPGFAGAEGYGYEVTTRYPNGGGQNSVAEYFTKCGGGNNPLPAEEVGYTLTVRGETLKAAAVVPHKYLPDEHELYGVFDPAWPQPNEPTTTVYQMKVPYAGNPLFPQACKPGVTPGKRTVEARYTGLGWEKISIPGFGGQFDAYRLNVILDQTQSGGTPGGLQAICGLFNFVEIFSQAFGIGTADDGNGGFITASIDRWYVRGIGLVKEKSTNYQTGTVLSEKVLTACSGLPGCP